MMVGFGIKERRGGRGLFRRGRIFGGGYSGAGVSVGYAATLLPGAKSGLTPVVRSQ